MEEQVRLEENKMGVMPINKLLISMSIPMMISMLVMALYNIVDSIFVAKLNEDALTAVSLAFPIQNLMIAFGTGTGVGVNALLSRSLGAKDTEYANKIANNGLKLSIFTYAAFAILTGVLGGFYFRVQTNNQAILNYGISYIHIVGVMSFGMFLQMMSEKLLQSTGKTIYTMITQLIGAITNIILDPILIFGLFGFPRLEVAGAAVATVAGQILAGIVALLFNMKYNQEIEINLKKYKLSSHVVGHIYSIGVPSIIMASVSSVMTFGMNKILMSFTATATAVFGVYYKLQSFVFMPVFGLNNGMVPIVAYNYGAKKPDRITKTIQLSIIYAVSIMLVGLVIMQMCPVALLKLFSASDSMLSIGVPALKTISFSFIFAGFCIVCSSVYQAFGHGVLSLLVSLIRQLAVLLPAAYILSKINGLDAIWWSFPIAEVASVILCTSFLIHVYRKEIKPLWN
ncbi:MAG: MATE family efflux transporter [Lachnospiraceae bacterium]|nr:MATE family efflux transporter [Lachnospiraceae bacterium]